MKFYVAASLRDEKIVKAVYGELRLRGHAVTYDWVATETKGAEWTSERRREVAAAEMQGVRDCDALVFITPGGRGAHCELGGAIALDRPVLFVTSVDVKFSLFYHHPRVQWLDLDHYALCDVVAAICDEAETLVMTAPPARPAPTSVPSSGVPRQDKGRK